MVVIAKNRLSRHVPRRLSLVVLVCIFGSLSFSHQTKAETLSQKLRAGFEAGDLPGLHGAIVELDGVRLGEVYFAGTDERWGKELGVVTQSADTVHDLRSVTKSIVGLLYGIALSEGKVPAPSEPLYKHFPEHADLLQQDPKRELITIEHALTMQMGIEWSEDLPYSDPRNSEVAMEYSANRYRYILERPIRNQPGQAWSYNGGAVALLGKLISDGTGMTLDAFAKDRLFDPLGIERFEWVVGRDGIPSAASGLRLRLPALVKIGRMLSENGRYGGRQIVPAEWLSRSFRSHTTVDQRTRYGYLWYLVGSAENIVAIAVGNGGQRLTIQPKYKLIVASFAGRYNDPDSWQTSLSVLLDYAVPAAKRVIEK